MASSSSLRGFSGLVPQRKVDPAQFHHSSLPPCWGWPGGRQCISWPMTQEERSLGAPRKTVISLSGRDLRKDGIFLPLDNTRSECDTWKTVPSWEREGATLRAEVACWGWQRGEADSSWGHHWASHHGRPGAALLLSFLLYAEIDSLIIPTNVGHCLLLCTAKDVLTHGVSKCQPWVGNVFPRPQEGTWQRHRPYRARKFSLSSWDNLVWEKEWTQNLGTESYHRSATSPPSGGGGRAEARPPSIQAMVPKPIKPGISGGIHWYQPASLEPSNSTEKTLRWLYAVYLGKTHWHNIRAYVYVGGGRYWTGTLKMHRQ